VIVSMSEAGKLSADQIRAFLEGSEEHRFRGKQRAEVYEWITRTLRAQEYRRQGKKMRGLLKRYVEKMTGRSRTQVTLLVARYREYSEVKVASYRRHSFASRFTRADVELLAKGDEAHETLSGPATKKILERELEQYKRAEYERLAGISVAHIYNLRQRPRYRERRMNYTKTRAVQVAIGERRKPRPDGKPGYLRVDTVHQGDLDGVKGVYHINIVDEVTQWQMVACVAAITQSHLRPVLQDLLDQFPFPIRGFHSDNGSEFINDMVSGLLRDLLIEQTKSRARQSNDNGLVESKNGAVIRKHMATRPVIFDRELSRCTTPGCLRIAFRRLRLHRAAARRRHPCLLQNPLQSVSEFPSSVRSAGAHRGPAREGEVRLQTLRHAVGNFANTGAGFAPRPELPQDRRQPSRLGPDCQRA
jgi:transposase InsO family protein